MKKKRRSPILLWALLAILVVVLILVIVLTVNSRPKAGPQEPSSQILSQESTPVSSDLIAPSSQESPSALPSSSQSTSEIIDASDPYLRLVNVDNPLPDDFEAETKVADNGLSLEVKAADALIDMFEDARQDGVRLVLTSGYRSVARQRVLFDNKVQEYKNQGYSDAEAKKAASLLVAYPGKSEHNTGLAADIIYEGYFNDYDDLYEEFDQSDAYAWLEKNAYKYGFILRYPKDKTDITGISYEPWHYRYVGVENAKKIRDSGLCLEEYLGKA